MGVEYTVMDWVVAGSVFGLIGCLWAVGVIVWRNRRLAQQERISRRLDWSAPTAGRTRVLRLWHEGQEATTTVHDTDGKRTLRNRFEQMCLQAGWTSSPAVIAGGLAVAGATAFGVGIIIAGNAIAGAGLAAVVLIGFRIYAGGRVTRRGAVFETQLVDALDLTARSLRAGHPLGTALGVIADEIAPPVGDVFARINDQQSVGVSLDEAIRQAAAGSASDDLKLFATAVAIQLRTGGNLASVIDRLAMVIRDRMQLNRRIRVLTAQTQFSKRILLALPFILFVLLNLLNPDYMGPMYTTRTGNMLLGAGAAGLALGTWSMNRLAVMKY